MSKSKSKTQNRADVARTILNTAKGTEAVAKSRDDAARVAAEVAANPIGEVDHMTLHAQTEAACVASLLLTLTGKEVTAVRNGGAIADDSPTRATFNGGCVDALGPIYPTKTGAVPKKLPKGGAIRNIVNVSHYMVTRHHDEAVKALGFVRSGRQAYTVPAEGIAEGIEALAEVLLTLDWGQDKDARATRTRRVKAIKPASDPVETLRRAVTQAKDGGVDRASAEAILTEVFGPSEAEAFAEAIDAAEAGEVAEVA